MRTAKTQSLQHHGGVAKFSTFKRGKHMSKIKHGLSILLLTAVAVLSMNAAENRALSLHPGNPHYLQFRGKPTILIGSGEHYGAVLNLDFDYVRYLDTLAAQGLNQTRTFSGVYCEPPGAFKIERNTLAPLPGRHIAPWARSEQSGRANGGNKFNLQQWDAAYFARLKDYMTQASRRGVVVEMVLFCPFYKDDMWLLSPMNAINNINGLGQVKREEVYTMDRHGGLLSIHEALVRKIISELNEFDNLYYEICNEPYFGGVTMEWQQRMIDTIVAAEKELPRQHLISLNIANGSKLVDHPPEAVSIFNFHYASPPGAVEMNYHLNRVIGDNETGFKGTGDTHYRMEGWEFILAGGALYSHLDYSFTAGCEDGTFNYPPTQPGGGNTAFRSQMRTLKNFIESFDFVCMKPDNRIIRGTPPKARTTVLMEEGRQYAFYIFGGTPGNLTFALPKGRYTTQWLNPVTGAVDQAQNLTHNGGDCVLQAPQYQQDIALRVMAE